ncbi:response regulator [Aquabacter sp. P-9]|uniref:response regulator n=1 Tax=Aquabacter sediminis TaxID=3029197 RepID=UPI00237E8916|nr:response regulator [Aquabacter sp. P-9]MDE1569348.1 response regulator [Aquabacter sp. P-9]
MEMANRAPDPSPTPVTILIVEDEALVRLVLSEALRDAGMRVVEAATAEEAEAALRAGLQVDLVFTDVRMPGSYDGLELARRIKRERADLPILVTSGHLDAESVRPIAVFVPKPYVLNDVLSTISSLLKRSASL